MQQLPAFPHSPWFQLQIQGDCLGHSPKLRPLSSHFPIRSKLLLSITPLSLLFWWPRGPTDSVCNNRCQIRLSEWGHIFRLLPIWVGPQRFTVLRIVSYLWLFEICLSVFFLMQKTCVESCQPINGFCTWKKKKKKKGKVYFLLISF